MSIWTFLSRVYYTKLLVISYTAKQPPIYLFYPLVVCRYVCMYIYACILDVSVYGLTYHHGCREMNAVLPSLSCIKVHLNMYGCMQNCNGLKLHSRVSDYILKCNKWLLMRILHIPPHILLYTCVCVSVCVCIDCS